MSVWPCIVPVDQGPEEDFSLNIFPEVGLTTTMWVPVHPVANCLLPSRRGFSAVRFAGDCVQVVFSGEGAVMRKLFLVKHSKLLGGRRLEREPHSFVASAS